ncbi:MAG: PAS-domain containing protein [Xanthobacteraceae bacterium]
MDFATPSNSLGHGAAGGREPASQVADAAQRGEAVQRAPGTPIKLIVFGGAVLIAALSIGTAWFVLNTRARALADAERELSNVALVLTEEIDRSFQSLTLVQASVIDGMQSLGLRSSADFERQMSGRDVHLMLKHKISGLPHIGALALINADGRVFSSTRQWPMPDISAAGQSFFKTLKADRDREWILSEPVHNRTADGTWTIYLSRKFTAPNGDLLGIVSGGMELKYFEEFFSSITLGKSASISLFRDDGVLLVRYPQIDAAVGEPFTEVIEPLKSRGHITLRLSGQLSGEDRIVAAQRVAHFPLLVVAGTSVPAVLADWRNQSRFLVGAAALVDGAAAIIIFQIVTRLRRGRNESERRLLEKTTQLDTALNNMSQGLALFGESARLVLYNRRYVEMNGLSAAEIRPGWTLLDVLQASQRAGNFLGSPPQHYSDVLAAIKRGEIYRAVRETAGGRFVQVINQPLSGGGWVSTHEDITERRSAEKERDRSREFLDLIIQNVPAVIIVKNADDLRYVLVNRAGERLWGMPKADLIGKTARELFPESTAATIAAHDRIVLQNRQKFFDEHMIQTAAGPRIVKATRLSIPLEGEPQFLLTVLEDVTERRQIERELQQAMKMEAVGRLTGGMAHDFNNLLLIIIGNLDLLQEEVAGNATAMEEVQAILQASLRGAELTRQMLAFSRRQPLQPKLVGINELVGNAARLLARTLGENIDISVHTTADLPSVLVDEAQLEAALVNIAINARDAMPTGGRLTIETKKMQFDADELVSAEGLAPGSYIVVVITDTGTGMPPDVLARIFEPFFTTKKPGEGTGLGLSMVYGFIKQSGGHVRAYSEVGRGTSFKLYLPQAAASAREAPIVRAQEVRKASGEEVILAVDDNPDVRRTVGNHLRDLGYQVVTAENAEKALQTIADPGKIDLLFTDVVMPGGMNGKQLALEARKQRPDLKVLFTSGFPGTSLSNNLDLDSGDALLCKPYRKHELAQRVREVLDGA